MRLVLHGALAQYGGPYTLAVQTPRQAVRLIGAQIPGFLAGSTVLSSGLVLGDEVSGAIANLAVTQALKGVTDADAQEYSDED
ncbi:hypothetical protein KL86APRO_12034 [uncultured Alphaproteobacteria bacterium]|uniref:Uncharacterized protein n=1 Tax=uncultured Alphaproteobacteria bacterium TaxID=91750 RepID=A0A212K2W1_9PROT|nr:hypothetical protein KL86APRO_12034 [uncultured Alphaproteobacteria bacterium]